MGHGRRAARTPATPRRALLALSLGLTSTLLGIGALASPALAARGHEFAGAFGWGVLNGSLALQRCTGESSGKPSDCMPGLSGNGEGQFDNPDGIALNEATGEIYVVDEANNRVEIFNSSGTELKGEINGSGSLPKEGTPAGHGTIATGAGAEVPTGEFDEPEEIAVDNSCAERHLAEPKCKEEDPSDGDVYVLDTRGHKVGTFEEERMVIDKYGPDGEYVGQITQNLDGSEFAKEGFRQLFGVAVDPRGEVWVEERNFGVVPDGAANYTNAKANEWIAFRSSEAELSNHAAPGFAVDAEDNLYVHNTFANGIGPRDRLAKFNAKGELLSAELDEEAPTGVAVEASSNNLYIAHEGSIHRVNASEVSPTSPAAITLETLNKDPRTIAPGTASFSGVAVDHATLTVLGADVAASRIDLFSPEAPGAPRILEGSEGVTNVSSSSASFQAEVNPRSEEEEAATRYSFRYGPCESAESCKGAPYTQSAPQPEGTLAANYEADQIQAHVQGLSPSTFYHVSVSAHNANGSASGGSEEVIFKTQGPQAAGLPDARQWQLVSPALKHGAVIRPNGVGVAQAAVDGDAISYLANAPTEAEPEGFSPSVQILSRRGAGAWESQDIATPHEVPGGVSLATAGEYQIFSSGLESALVAPIGPFSKEISAQGSEQTLYLREDFPANNPQDPCSSSCYRPLVTGCPGGGEACPKAVEEVANVPEGTKFGEGHGLPTFLGASPDLSHVVFEAGAKLSEEAPAEEGRSLYEWVAGKLALMSVLPDGQAVRPAATPALGYLSESGGGRIARHALSSDGSRAVFTESTGSHHLYLREMTPGQEETIELDSPQGGCGAHCTGNPRPIFQTASGDDSRVFFTDSEPLTAASGKSDLYECQIEVSEEGTLACKLSDLTLPEAGEAGVLGLVAGAGEDGAAIYFTANGKLTSQPSARGEAAVAGDCKGDTAVGTLESETAPESCNLYERVGGQTRLIAVLSGADFPDWSLREGYGLWGLSDRVSPDGRYLAFMSRRSLTGYDNRDAVSGKPDQEVFLYDGETNSLSCASCEPSGARPHGVQYKQIDAFNNGLAGAARIWPQGAWIAANLPGWSVLNEVQGFALQQSRYLDDSGRLFFNSSDALVPQDSNSSEDVYEYEPPGVGSCNGAQPTYNPASGGCVALISSGTAKEESAFLEASENGDDVFFLTAQRLLPKEDLDQSLDVYDAHVCSESSPCLPEAATPPPACEGDACQSPGSPPEDQTPGSLTYVGPGNPAPPAPAKAKPKSAAELRAEKLKSALKACEKKQNKKKRAACEARARKLYGPKKQAKKSKKAAKKSSKAKGKKS